MVDRNVSARSLTEEGVLRPGQTGGGRRVLPSRSDERVDVDGLQQHPGEGRREEEVHRDGDGAAVGLVAALQRDGGRNSKG